ncbi:MAG: MarR family transcriptional regulator [Clostridia bacterium]|nr:MarR family transcriptional regulator [Clostridia bacterium]
MNKYEALKLKYQLCFPLYCASKEVIRRYRPLLERLNLTYTQYITMMAFWEYKSLNVKELGKLLMLDSGTLSPLLKSLEAKKFVARVKSEKDNREVIFVITDEGESLKERAVEIPQEIAGCISLSFDEAKQLHVLLNKILEK